MHPSPAPATKDELRMRIRKIFVEQSDVDPRTLTGATRIAELGLDGVGTIALMMALEDTFDLEIPEADADGLKSLQEVVDYVARRLGI